LLVGNGQDGGATGQAGTNGNDGANGNSSQWEANEPGSTPSSGSFHIAKSGLTITLHLVIFINYHF